MKVIIENVSKSIANVWSAEVSPQDLIKLGRPMHQGGGVSVVLIRNPSVDGDAQKMQFDLDSAVVLCLGNTLETILIGARGSRSNIEGNAAEPKSELSAGDYSFIKALEILPERLQQIGKNLLFEIRKVFPGELRYKPKSSKFVESPDNFWVVRIQPRVKSLRIIIYGRPEEHQDYVTIRLKQDMASYSSFIVEDEAQLPDALSVIKEAKRLKDKKH